MDEDKIADEAAGEGGVTAEVAERPMPPLPLVDQRGRAERRAAPFGLEERRFRSL